jgi:stearoyl-CoA desaturase (delta-9 desaturase)
MQGEICSWVRSHLTHHVHCEKEGKDPHTPRDGFMHAWCGWLVWGPDFKGEPLKAHQNSRPLMWQHKGNNYMWLTLFMNFVLPALLALGLWATGLLGPWHHMIWVYVVCALARTYQFHATILGVNVFAHMWGKKKYLTHASKADDSKDNLFAALSTTGEGFHNWHHSWPWAATHAPVKGLHNRLVDLSGSVILLLEKVGLAWDVKLPTPDQITRAKEAAKLAAKSAAEDAAEAAQLALEASVGLKRAKVKVSKEQS